MSIADVVERVEQRMSDRIFDGTKHQYTCECRKCFDVKLDALVSKSEKLTND